jgi:hypothetical protein
MFEVTRIPLPALGALALFAVVSAGPSMALTAKECSVKYQAAKTAGTLGGQTWSDFRKKECGGAVQATAAAPTGAVFPKSVDPKYAKKSAGKARFYTCLDQYRANKATNGNGGLKWVQKGGGYYSLCNKALKS